MSQIFDISNGRPAARTEKQRAASRANGAKGRGPVTPEGKRLSALNAIRHNLASTAIVLSNEERPRFQTLLDGYFAEYRPVGPTQIDLVEQMAAAKWRERRAWSLEAATLDFAMDSTESRLAAEIQSTDEPTRCALAFNDRADNSCGLDLLHRYEARHARTWRLALRQLQELQKANSPNEPGDLTDSKAAAA